MRSVRTCVMLRPSEVPCGSRHQRIRAGRDRCSLTLGQNFFSPLISPFVCKTSLLRITPCYSQPDTSRDLAGRCIFPPWEAIVEGCNQASQLSSFTSWDSGRLEIGSGGFVCVQPVQMMLDLIKEDNILPGNIRHLQLQACIVWF